MRIARVQVDEGFLDGLNLKFSQGLNVIIGPRGSGKTSVVELIRFCLNVGAITEGQDRAARAHALAILGSGTIAVTLADDDNETIRVVRSAEDEEPRTEYEFPAPLIVSQNEIEEIGLRAESRLELIDRFAREASADQWESVGGEGIVESLTRQIASLRAEVEAMRSETASLESVAQQVAALTVEQNKLRSQLKASEPVQKELDQLNVSLALTRGRQAALDGSRAKILQWRTSISQLTSRHIELEPWPEEAITEDWLATARRRLEKSVEALGRIEAVADELVQNVNDLSKRNKAESVVLDDRARTLRRKMDAVKQGAGEVSKKLQDLEARKSKLTSLQNNIKVRHEQIAKLTTKRNLELDQIDGRREAKYAIRKRVASKLNNALKPLIRIDLEHSARHEGYASAIAAALRGSGTKYNIWAPKLSAALSPRELVTAIETQNSDALVEGVERLSSEQAIRLLSQFDPEGLGPILTSEVEDDVQFSLFDGSEYKQALELSTGQRCTVVLPILLRQTSEPLVIDQPEDHLDNAFIVDTLVRGMVEQKKRIQIICTTHNANIPVLGGAELVVTMGSDGSHAFVVNAAPLEDNRSIKAITEIMEGGMEAFKLRAEFYERAARDSRSS